MDPLSLSLCEASLLVTAAVEWLEREMIMWRELIGGASLLLNTSGSCQFILQWRLNQLTFSAEESDSGETYTMHTQQQPRGKHHNFYANKLFSSRTGDKLVGERVRCEARFSVIYEFRCFQIVVPSCNQVNKQQLAQRSLVVRTFDFLIFSFSSDQSNAPNTLSLI